MVAWTLIGRIINGLTTIVNRAFIIPHITDMTKSMKQNFHEAIARHFMISLKLFGIIFIGIGCASSVVLVIYLSFFPNAVYGLQTEVLISNVLLCVWATLGAVGSVNNGFLNFKEMQKFHLRIALAAAIIFIPLKLLPLQYGGFILLASLTMLTRFFTVGLTFCRLTKWVEQHGTSKSLQ